MVVPKSAVLWTISVADFGTINHTRKQCFASVLIGSEVRKAADPNATNFRTGTLAQIAIGRSAGDDGRPVAPPPISLNQPAKVVLPMRPRPIRNRALPLPHNVGQAVAVYREE